MKKVIIVNLILIGLIGGCDYLDVVPNDTPNLGHAFSNRSVAEKFLRTCYSALPDITSNNYPGWFTSRDEVDYGYELRMAESHAAFIARGFQNTNAPRLNYWSGSDGGRALYTAIRDCNIFLENIHIPKDILEKERTRWIAEVKFLKAYYHFFLMQLYGPIVLVDKNLPPSATPEEVRVYREPINEVVDFIVNLLDEAIPDLPLVLPDPTSEYGRITKLIALSVKAKVLIWGASPLFNGNPDYKNWIDNRAKQLIPDIFVKEKWERAAEAIKNAIDSCHLAGLQLYQFNKFEGGAKTFNMNDSLVQLMTIRKSITEKVERNTGLIWASQETFGPKGSVSPHVLNDLIRMFFPPLYPEDTKLFVGYYSAAWHMAELYYSNNGVPISEDKNYNYSGRYNLRRATPGDKHQSYIATGETTIELHFNREPRFYASLGFDRGFYEIASATENGGRSFSPYIRMRAGEIKENNLGYYVKKIVPFETSASQGDPNKDYSEQDYRFPIIRLADLYLLYSEALNEIKELPDDEVFYWIDLVRQNAGLEGVVKSWNAFSINPNKVDTQEGMREIIRRERLIELSFETQRYWDLRRWKIADKYWSLPPTKWKLSKNIDEAYIKELYNPTVRFSFRDFLFPLREYDLRINRNLIQTYGW